MLILALDTTMRVGSCAIARDGIVMRELASNPKRSHAEHLPGDLMALLDGEAIALPAIDVFAVATGPGSFTGLRVGIATMQGLAFAMGKPLLGISALDALAALASGPRFVATWVDAWRGEVYAALYDSGTEVEPPTVEHPAHVLERHRRRGDVVFVGDGAATFAALIRSTLGDNGVVADPPSPLLAGTIAELAHAAATIGHRPPPDAIKPMYVRRTDAELARDARSRR